ncbi:hypothetical protein [Cryptosporangium minutisporangium]|uniref:Uncharacterized protein n=1 Tax=Cryptosporangium minutisporangium TaxID=113569 RepID=A0ABP6T999_9ACTN
MTAPSSDRRTVWSRRIVLVAAFVFGVGLLLDLVAYRWLSPALLGLLGCAMWLRWGPAGRAGRPGRAGLLAVPVLVGAVLWCGVSWYLTPVVELSSADAAPRLAVEIPLPGATYSDSFYDAELYRAGEAELDRPAEAEAVSVAAPLGGRGPDVVGAGAALLALAGIGLRVVGREAAAGRLPPRFRSPTWDVREVLLLAVAAALAWVSTWTWAVRTTTDRTETVVRDDDSAAWSSVADIEVAVVWGWSASPWWAGTVVLAVGAIGLWLACAGPSGVRPRWLAGTTLGLLGAALGAAFAGARGTDSAGPGLPAAIVLLVVAVVLVGTAPAATAVRALRGRPDQAGSANR